MKYVRTPGFLIDLRRLPDEHRKLFVESVHELLRPALDAGAHRGTAPVATGARGKVVTEPFDIPVGQVTVVADPFDNILVLLDLSKGHYVTDKTGNVTAVAC